MFSRENSNMVELGSYELALSSSAPLTESNSRIDESSLSPGVGSQSPDSKVR